MMSGTHLDSRLGQAGLGCQSFAGAYTWVVAFVKLSFQFVQLVRTERGPVAPELWLFRFAADTLNIVFAIHTAAAGRS